MPPLSFPRPSVIPAKECHPCAGMSSPRRRGQGQGSIFYSFFPNKSPFINAACRRQRWDSSVIARSETMSVPSKKNWGNDSYKDKKGKSKFALTIYCWGVIKRGSYIATECKCAARPQMINCFNCVKDVWNETHYDHWFRHCGTFAADAMSKCCLKFPVNHGKPERFGWKKNLCG